MNLENLKRQFREEFGHDRFEAYFAPGRVNLIGEHTDYNGGYVLPCALSFGTYLLIGENGQEKMRMVSANFPFKADIPLSQIGNQQAREWVNYPLGVIDQFTRKKVQVPGLDLLYSGNIPNGAGLSSSASIEMVTAVALNDILKTGFSRIDLIKMGRAAENEFVGMNCGIMDQFIVGMGKADSALFLDCRTLDYELVSMQMAGYSILVANTNKRRELADSKYNERVAECADALRILSSVRPLIDLSDMQLEEFTSHEGLFSNEIIRKRARHVISENNRVKKAVQALKEGDLVQFGQLMNQSHESLRTDYEVTGNELDAIVHSAQSMDGVLGARMTGAGFGGCSVNLVKSEAIDEVKSWVGREYNRKTGLTADFYIASIGDGAGKV